MRCVDLDRLEPARSAIERSAAGSMQRSLVATTVQDGRVFQAAACAFSSNAETAAGRWEYAACPSTSAGTSAAKTDGNNSGAIESSTEVSAGGAQRKRAGSQRGAERHVREARVDLAERLAHVGDERRDVHERRDVLRRCTRDGDDGAAVGVTDEDDRSSIWLTKLAM